MERNDDVGLDGKKPSPQTRTNKGSSTNPIYDILLRYTTHGRPVKIYFAQVKTSKTISTKDPCQMRVQITKIARSVRQES